MRLIRAVRVLSCSPVSMSASLSGGAESPAVGCDLLPKDPVSGAVFQRGASGQPRSIGGGTTFWAPAKHLSFHPWSSRCITFSCCRRLASRVHCRIRSAVALGRHCSCRAESRVSRRAFESKHQIMIKGRAGGRRCGNNSGRPDLFERAGMNGFLSTTCPTHNFTDHRARIVCWLQTAYLAAGEERG